MGYKHGAPHTHGFNKPVLAHVHGQSSPNPGFEQGEVKPKLEPKNFSPAKAGMTEDKAGQPKGRGNK